MAGSLSAYAEKKTLDAFFKGTLVAQPTNLYVALSTANPLDDASGLAEPSGNNYSRVNMNDWDAAATVSGKAQSANTSDITFPTPSGSWGACAYFAIFDASTGGNMIFHGTLDASATPDASNPVYFPAGSLVLQLSGKLSDAINIGLLDHWLKNTAFTQPTNIYVALSTADPGADGSTIAEPDTGDAYARKLCNTWDAATTSGGVGVNANTNAVSYDQATGDWGNITWFALFSASTAGTYYGRGQLSTARNVVTGYIPEFAAGEIAFNAE